MQSSLVSRAATAAHQSRHTSGKTKRRHRRLHRRLFVESIETRRLFSFNGAIFTTDVSGNPVNANIYDNRLDVYLNGGPNSPVGTGPSLPVGDYYVKVTEPDGDLLGTSVGRPEGEKPVVVTDASDGVLGNGQGIFSGLQLWDIVIKASDSSKGYDLTTNPGGEYKAWLSTVASFDNNESKTDNFKVRENIVTPPNPVDINVEKYYDTNGDGDRDAGEPGLAGWRIFIDEDGPGHTTGAFDVGEAFVITNASGQGKFSNVPVGTYNVFEDLVNAPTPRPGNTWFQTDGIGGVSTVVTETSATPDPVQFGNVEIGAGGGKTLGFWSNKNGQALISAADLAELVNLNLRNADGSHFNPTTYAQLRTWLLNGNATNMAYMLSVQLTALKLAVYNGLVNGNALILAVGSDAAAGGFFAKVNDVIGEANALLGTGGAANLVVLSDHPLRAKMALIKDILDDANNNGIFLQPPP